MKIPKKKVKDTAYSARPTAHNRRCDRNDSHIKIVPSHQMEPNDDSRRCSQPKGNRTQEQEDSVRRSEGVKSMATAQPKEHMGVGKKLEVVLLVRKARQMVPSRRQALDDNFVFS